MKITGLALAGLLPSLALLPSSACAAGLGRLVVSSSLGQPLRGEIEIVAVQPNEADSLSAVVAPPEAFRQANVEQSGALQDVRFKVESRPNGQYVLVLNSLRPVNEPFLDMLVQLEWTGGRLVREYTFLLDPPEYKAGSAVASSAPPVTPPTTQSLPAEKPAAVPEPLPAAQPAAPAAASKPAGSYEVKRGDTLAKIARATAPQGVSLQQMLVALYRSNGDAFLGNNMNRLRAGRILNIPAKDEALSIDLQEARRLVRSQGAAYADYQRSIGVAVAAAPARPEAGRQASGRITTPTEEKPAPPKESQSDQLRLSKPDDAKGSARARAAASADDAVAKDKTLKEAQDRVAALEKNVADLQKLLALKSAPGAQAQADAAKGTAKAEPPKPTPAAPAPAPAAKAEPSKAPAVPPKTEAAPAPAPKAAEPAAIAAAPEAPKAPDAGKSAPPKAAPKPAAPPEPSLIDELLENVYALAGAAVVVVLLIGYAVWAWRRKKRDAEERFGPSMMGTSSMAPSSVLGAAGGKSIDTGSGAMPMDFSAGGPAKTEAEEIDPVAEADVYMAYGRDAQAEEILREALNKDPSRVPVRLKLLEIYANRKDAKSFEAVARELHTSTSGQGPDWDKAAALGRQIDPGNSLYGGGTADATPMPAAAPAAKLPSEEPTAIAPLDFDLDVGAPATAAAVPDINLDAPPAESDQTVAIDFNLDLGAAKPAAESAKKEEFSDEATVVLKPEDREAAEAASSGGLDFDLGLSEPAPAAEKPAAPEPAPESAAPDSSGGIDFDLNAGAEPAAAPAPAPEPAPEPAAAASGSSIEFDIKLPELGPAPEPEPAPAPAAPKEAAPAASAGGIDFDFKLDTGGVAPAGTPQAAPETIATPEPALDLSAISLDLGDAPTMPLAGAGDAKWQEVATKLDLAKAYEEMGDKDGARDLLNEVMKEGDTAQQEQAKTLLGTLS